MINGVSSTIQEQFRLIFNIELGVFQSKLMMVGIFDFDIIRFDRWYKNKYGNYESKNISLANAIQKRFGKDTSKMITTLCKIKT